MMLDDGRVAVIREVLRLRLIISDSVPKGDLRAQEGAWEIIGEALGDDEIILYGVDQAHCSPAHIKLICKVLMHDRYRHAYAEWVDGGTLPFCEAVESGEIAGWWRIDLVGWRLGQRYCR